MICKSAVGPLRALVVRPWTLFSRVLFIAVLTVGTSAGVLSIARAQQPPKTESAMATLDARKAAPSAPIPSSVPARILAANPSKRMDANLLLEHLIIDAGSILYGRVGPVSREHVVQKLDGVETTLVVRIVPFQWSTFLKGGGGRRVPTTVRNYAPVAPGVREGEEILWFLDSASANNLDAFVVDYAADFRISPDLRDSGKSYKVAISLAQNRGLWGDRLWTPTLKREEVREYLEKLVKDSKLSAERRDDILNVGDNPCQPRPLPLELLLAAIHVRLEGTTPSVRQ